MRHTWWVGALAAVLTSGPVQAADKEDIDRAVNLGVAGLRGLQKNDGSWPHNEVGATALAALTLLECGADKDDRAVTTAVNYVRTRSVSLNHTYSIALSILLLDRLGESADVPLIESLTARLVGGQSQTTGMWTYICPVPVPVEQQRLTELIARRPGEKDEVRTTPKSGSTVREFQQRMLLLNMASKPNGGLQNQGDNSNTQFATIALWVSRRHGFPVDGSLRLVEAHFRTTQNVDGGWSYLIYGTRTDHQLTNSTATMTCAGLLGLAVGYGVSNDNRAKAKSSDKAKGSDKDKDKGLRDPSKDPALKAALLALGLTIGVPLERQAERRGRHREEVPPSFAGAASGRSYYFLWSLERVAVALNLDTIGKKDWYGWGTDILILSQQPNGLWQGEFGLSGADTCFALLFLKRANLTKDLSKLTGRIQDPGERSLRAGGVGGGALGAGSHKEESQGIKSGIENTTTQKTDEKPPSNARTITPSTTPVFGDTQSGKLAQALVALPAERQGTEIERLRDQKGVAYTEALAAAIPALSGESRLKARDALAERFARMKAETIDKYLEDEDPEIRRAATLACALKENKQSIPRLIRLLSDREPIVARAAYAALKDLTGQDFGPAAGADEAARNRAAVDWQTWWKGQSR